jgi:hypothetical protein
MRHGIQALAVLVFVLALLLASSAASAQVIQACAHKQTGVLRLVADLENCGQNESAVSWSQQGPHGEKGDPGDQGPPGPPLGRFDGAGSLLGIAVGAGVFNEEIGMQIPFQTLRGRVGGRLSFPEQECQGQAYITNSSGQQNPNAAGSLFGPYPERGIGSDRIFSRFFAARTEVHLNVSVFSELNPESMNCNSWAEPHQVLEAATPADPFTGELSFTIPVVEPIYVGIAP